MRTIGLFVLLAATVACSRESTRASAPPVPAASSAPAVHASAGTEVGNMMPAYSAKTLEGKSFDLAGEKGSVIFLNVWATWCGPCRYEIPQLQALHNKFAPSGFKVIGISVDESGTPAVAQFVATNKITYPVEIDAEGHITDLLHTSVLPTSVLIARDGRVLWRSVGAMTPNDVPAVEGMIEKALQTKS